MVLATTSGSSPVVLFSPVDSPLVVSIISLYVPVDRSTLVFSWPIPLETFPFSV